MTSPVRYGSLNIGDTTDDIQIGMRGGKLDVSGLIGLPPVRSNDQDRGQGDGSTGGWDTYGARVITFGLQCAGGGGTSVREALQPLADGWTLLRSGEGELELEFPGQPTTVMSYFGRPREIDERSIMWGGAGMIEVDATFDALDPFGYGAVTSSAVDSSTPISVTNAGNVTSYRATLTVVGNGDTPAITNTTDPDVGDIVWTTALANLAEAEIDLRAMEVTVGGVHKESQISPASLWFGLEPGVNSITFTGCTSVQIDYRSAWR